MTHEQFFACYQALHVTFHKHWTDAVGKPGYVKAHWTALDNEMSRVWRDAATALGIPRDAPLIQWCGR